MRLGAAVGPASALRAQRPSLQAGLFSAQHHGHMHTHFPSESRPNSGMFLPFSDCTWIVQVTLIDFMQVCYGAKGSAEGASWMQMGRVRAAAACASREPSGGRLLRRTPRLRPAPFQAGISEPHFKRQFSVAELFVWAKSSPCALHHRAAIVLCMLTDMP